MTEREEEYRGYFEVLELSPGASRSELRAAYQHLRELYSSESIALSPLDHELSDEWKRDVLERVEDAYAKLTSLSEESLEVVRGMADFLFPGEVQDEAVLQGSQVMLRPNSTKTWRASSTQHGHMGEQTPEERTLYENIFDAFLRGPLRRHGITRPS